MDRPRLRSSSSRSGSCPVSAWTSVDLPWSTWPAVATTYTSVAWVARVVEHPAYGADEYVVLVIGHRNQVEQQPAVDDVTDHGRVAAAQRLGQVCRE